VLDDHVDIRGLQGAARVGAEDQDLVDEVQRSASLFQPVEHVVEKRGGACALHEEPPLGGSG
jgi:hypothetical protein